MKTKFTLFTMLLLFVSWNNVTKAQWQQVNTGLTSNNVNAVLTTGSNVLAATDAGLFISTNDGTLWTAVTDTNFTGTDVRALTSNGTNVFAATFSKGIFMSADNGVTWTAKNSGFTFLYACAVASVGTKIYASMSFDGVYSSIDNGTTWTKITDPVLSAITVNSILMSGSNMIASSGSCSGGTTGGVFLSTDGGTTWAATSVTGDADELAIVGSTVFAATQNGVYKSTDNGATWTLTTTTSGVIDNAIALYSNGSKLFVGCPYSVYSTTDNGTTWTDISTGAGAINLSVTSFAVNSTYVFISNIYHSIGVWRRPIAELGITMSIADLTNDNSIKAYPNPTNEILFLEVNDFKNSTVEIFNLQGELVQSVALQSSRTSINTNGFISGSYILKVKGQEKNSVLKFVKN